jgi:RNA polymerase sigma factor
MNRDEFLTLMKQTHQGSQTARERLIRHYRPYVLNTAGHICKRYISWSDEEFSISLIAFNRAIDTFEENSGRSFLNYAYLLIKRDLIDYFRKERNEQHLSLNYSSTEEEHHTNPLEIEKSLDIHDKEVASGELVEEILEYDQELQKYKVSFDEMEDCSPKHTDTRAKLYEVANQFIGDSECKQSFLVKKRLPITLFSKKTGYPKKTMEKHRKYLIALILLKLNPQWTHLSRFMND